MHSHSCNAKADAVVIFVFCLAVIGTAASIILLRKGREDPSLPCMETIYQDFTQSQRTLNSLFSRVQRDNIRIHNVMDFQRYHDLGLHDGQIVSGVYRILPDFHPQALSESNILPPMIAAPFQKHMLNSPTNIYPVLLFRPEDNPPDALLPKLRLLFMTRVEIDNIFKAESMYSYIASKHQFVTVHQSNYWPYYSQSAVSSYFNPPGEK